MSDQSGKNGKTDKNGKKNDALTPAGTEPATEKEKPGKKGKARKKKRIGAGKVILILILVLLLALAAVFFIPPLRTAVLGRIIGRAASAASGGYHYYTVEKRDITTTLTGTGTLQPYDSYLVTASVTGDIVSADFEEMDEVQEDDVLFVIDSSDLEDDIEDLRKDVADALEDYNDALEDYEDLKVYAPCGGTVRTLYVEEDDSVNTGMNIAYLVDNGTMLLDIPFFAANVDFVRTGDRALVTFASTGEVLSGTVTEISNLLGTNENGSSVRNLTVSVRNPGGITFGMQAYASVTASDGTLYDCAGAGAFRYREEETASADAAGKIKTLYVDEGDVVAEGALIAELSSDTLDDRVEQLKKAYDNQVKALDDMLDRLEDYTIKAPISGTVVQKNYKALDTIGGNSMSSTTTLAMIYDMSKLTFDLSIDELDLEMIEVGQKVKITSDSIEGAVYEGVVTKKSIVGSSSGGTTVYPVTVELDGGGRLLPGMNVNAEIVVSSTGNVLAVPVSAVLRGNRVEVVRGEFSAERREGVVAEKPETETVSVELGANDSEYIEVRSGLSEGDVIVYEVTNVTQDLFSAMFNGMSGGMGMGGMPAGGMGGMPSGSRSSSGMSGMPSGSRSSGGMPSGR